MAATTNPIDALLQRANDLNIANENGLREFMKLAREHDKDFYEDILKRYSIDQQRMLRAFADDRSLTDLARECHATCPRPSGAKPVDLMLHDLCFEGLSFQNWGKTVKNSPQLTCIPDTVHGVQMVIKYAKAKNYGVRVAGYRHSWSSIFGRENIDKNHPFILISTLPLDRAILRGPGKEGQALDPGLRNQEADGVYIGVHTELNKIEMKNDGRVRVGCATTNEDFRRWCLEEKKWTLPLNVIMVEITFGGSNAPICHGAGYNTKTLSDLVEMIEYVDANGNVQTISNSSAEKEMLSAASGCFGLLGVVTHLTLRLDKMSIAKMEPQKMPILEAIPPPTDMAVSDLPHHLQDAYAKLKPNIQTFVDKFEKRALEDYYAEWFWFPLHGQVWVNTWGLTKEHEEIIKSEEYPSKEVTAQQVLASYLIEWSHEYNYKHRKDQPAVTTKALSDLAMTALPSMGDGQGGAIFTQLSNALHFRRGIQNFRVRDLEVEIPLPPKIDNSSKPNLDIVRKAWWQAIIEVYKKEAMETCPMRMPLEMRITGGSDVLMAPQRGNKLGTCSIEVLTPLYMAEEWEAFAQKVLDKWMALRNEQGGQKPLNIRPHWAKEWQQYKVDNKPWVDYLRTNSYKDEITAFKKTLAEIAKKHKWDEKDRRQLFSNELLDQLLGQ